jgi:hypothetical protein
MYIQKYIQKKFGALIDKRHYKTLEQIMSDYWKEASKDMFIPQTTSGHGLMAIKIFLEDDVERVFYYVGEKKRLELFTSNDRKLTEYVKKYATTKSKSRIESFLKKHKKHKIFLEFRFWADEDSHEVICEDCDKEIPVAYSEEDEEWIKIAPQYDIADMPNDLGDILYYLVKKGINIDEFGQELDILIEKSKKLLVEKN